MPNLGQVLVIDESLVMRELLRTLLAAHSTGIVTAGTFAEGRGELRGPGDRDAARGLGAVDYLAKPLSFRALARAAAGCRPGTAPTRSGDRARTGASAWVLDPGGQRGRILDLDLVDLSTSGAFLATPGPVALGTRLHLDLPVDGDSVRVRARVVRLQEPGWGRCGGIGVKFESLDDEASRRLADHLARATRRGNGRLPPPYW